MRACANQGGSYHAQLVGPSSFAVGVWLSSCVRGPFRQDSVIKHVDVGLQRDGIDVQLLSGSVYVQAKITKLPVGVSMEEVHVMAARSLDKIRTMLEDMLQEDIAQCARSRPPHSSFRFALRPRFGGGCRCRGRPDALPALSLFSVVDSTLTIQEVGEQDSDSHTKCEACGRL